VLVEPGADLIRGDIHSPLPFPTILVVLDIAQEALGSRVTGDERDYLVGFGSYDLPSDTLTMRFCGPNRNAHPGELIGRVEP
jgi:hypothetical protein